jgi:hypothetical protein
VEWLRKRVATEPGATTDHPLRFHKNSLQSAQTLGRRQSARISNSLSFIWLHMARDRDLRRYVIENPDRISFHRR